MALGPGSWGRPANDHFPENLRAPSDGGNSGGMEPRIAKLEAHVEHMRGDIGELKADVRALKADTTQMRSDLATANTRIEALPTKEYVGTTMRNWVLVGAGIVAAANAVAVLVNNLLK